MPLLGPTAGLQFVATFQLPVPPTHVANACDALAGRGNSSPNAKATTSRPNPALTKCLDRTAMLSPSPLDQQVVEPPGRPLRLAASLRRSGGPSMARSN